MSENPAGRRDDPCDRGRCAKDWVPATTRGERRISMEPCCGQIVRRAVPRGYPLRLLTFLCRCAGGRDAKNSGGTSDHTARLRSVILTKPQSRHLHLGRVHKVDRSDDFRAIYSVCAYLDQLSVDWQSKELSDARRSATINAKNSY